MSAEDGKKGKRIAPAEMEILRYVMEHQPVTARQVADAIGESKGFARSTSQTLLERLRKKGHLTRSIDAGVNVYSLAGDKKEVQKHLFADFFETTLGGSLSPFVAFLADRGSLTAQETEELRRLLKKAEEEGK